jgi:hypothetical protein
VTQLPATLVEAEATRFATDWLAERCHLDLFGLGVPTLDSQAGLIFLRQALKRMALAHPIQMMTVIEYARTGWDEAQEALRELAIEIMDRGEPLPTALGAYVMEVLHFGQPARARGPKKAKIALQDIFAAGLMVELLLRFPTLNPTRRGSHKDRPCACSIAAAAITGARIGRPMDYKTAERIWSLWGKGLWPTGAGFRPAPGRN